MMPSSPTNHIIEVHDLCVNYSPGAFAKLFGASTTYAVRAVSFAVQPGTTFGIVGESGSGKSTTVRAIMGLERATSGDILYDGQSLVTPSASSRRRVSRELQMVFQDPSSALNPKMKVGGLLTERIRIHRPQEWAKRAEIAETSLTEVGLPLEHLHRFPHQLSGGQQQRVVIALGLISQPRLLICDEAVSGLDVSSQAQVLNLLNHLKRDRNLTIIFITHDMGVARYISDEVAVMRKGEIVEQGRATQVFDAPSHEYTKSLIDAVPRLPHRYETGRENAEMIP